MDEDRIGLVLARASELRSKITNCIHESSALRTHPNANKSEQKTEDDNPSSRFDGGGGEADPEEEDDDGEAESLLNIRDALESLEAQLSSLQALQQQQWYEKEAALAEIDHSRKLLLKKLKEYKGDNLEVIHEATAFASETVEENNNDLLLPPYPSRPSHFPPSQKKITQNGSFSGNPNPETKRNNVQPESKSSFGGVGLFIGSAVKAFLTVLGVISVMGLAGFEPRVRRRRGIAGENGFLCPPGKIPVVENGETRCVVKERVEIPFESVVTAPDVNYGCG